MWTRQLDHPPQIRLVMTPFPYWIDASRSPREARLLMQHHQVHHIPVMDGDRILGVLSDRELAQHGDDGAGPADLPVGALCARGALIVASHEPLSSVLRAMAERSIDCALVTRDGRLAGIFTTTDVCRRLAELIDALFDRGEPRPA